MYDTTIPRLSTPKIVSSARLNDAAARQKHGVILALLIPLTGGVLWQVLYCAERSH